MTSEIWVALTIENCFEDTVLSQRTANQIDRDSGDFIGALQNVPLYELLTGFMFRVIQFNSFAVRRTIGVLLFVHLFAVMVMAGLADLHKLSHPDAESAHHECAVTVYIKGGLESGTTVTLLVVCFGSVLFRLIQPEIIPLQNLFLSRGVLEHAPPQA